VPGFFALPFYAHALPLMNIKVNEIAAVGSMPPKAHAGTSDVNSGKLGPSQELDNSALGR